MQSKLFSATDQPPTHITDYAIKLFCFRAGGSGFFVHLQCQTHVIK